MQHYVNTETDNVTVACSDRLKTEEDQLNIETVAALLLLIMPLHHLMYENVCHGNNNNLISIIQKLSV